MDTHELNKNIAKMMGYSVVPISVDDLPDSLAIGGFNLLYRGEIADQRIMYPGSTMNEDSAWQQFFIASSYTSNLFRAYQLVDTIPGCVDFSSTRRKIGRSTAWKASIVDYRNLNDIQQTDSEWVDSLPLAICNAWLEWKQQEE